MVLKIKLKIKWEKKQYSWLGTDICRIYGITKGGIGYYLVPENTGLREDPTYGPFPSLKKAKIVAEFLNEV